MKTNSQTGVALTGRVSPLIPYQILLYQVREEARFAFLLSAGFFNTTVISPVQARGPFIHYRNKPFLGSGPAEW